jgi:excisionase family DNA binding protein
MARSKCVPKQSTTGVALRARFASVKEAADYLGLKTNSIRALAHNGELPYTTIAKKWLFVYEDLDRFVDNARGGVFAGHAD